jgi:hypothetical protein
MKKTIFILMALLWCGRGLIAQQVAIEKSAEFDEPEYGWNKLLQLKNGNTFYFHSTKKEGIEVTVYNKQRKQINSRTLESRLWDIGKMRQSKIVGLYEINGEPVLFIVQDDDHVPTLYRMRINPNNGSIVNESTMGHLPKTNVWAAYSMKSGIMEASDIIVEKDPQSDCYALIFFNTLAHDRSERIKVMHYDGTHKLLGQAFYESPKGAFKYLVYIGAVVDGSKRVFVTTYGYNTKSDDESARVIISRLNAGDTGFVHNLLDFSEDFDDTKSVMLYNHNNNTIQLLTLSYTKSKHHFINNKTDNFYLTLMSYINPETLQLISVKPLTGEKVNAYGKQNIDNDYEYTGMPQQMVINKDNTTTVLSEDITLVIKTYSHGGTIERSLLGPIGVTELSDTGAELRGYAISKKQQAEGLLPELYINTRSKGRFMYPQTVKLVGSKSNDNQFLSFDYVNAEKGHYIIFNDLPANSDKDEDEEKRKAVVNVSNTNTMCYKLNDPKMDKFYLFGEPDDKHNSTFCYIESSDYNKDLNTYATMIVERDGRDKEAKIAWVTFQ